MSAADTGSSGVSGDSIAAADANDNGDTVADDRISAEIETITQQIRRALECPVCLMFVSNMSCFCPNGHAMCDMCLVRMWDLNTMHICPMCRSPMATTMDMSATAMKLAEVISLVKVACTHRSYGCTELVTVVNVMEHEAQCSFVPDIRCFVSTCQWVGVYEKLFDHVCRTHPKNSVESNTNHRLFVDDADAILYNCRRTYLVRTTFGMLWLLLFKETRSRIRIGVFMVEKQITGRTEEQPNQNPTNMLYRITWSDFEGRSRTLSRARSVVWSSALKDCRRNGITATGKVDPFTMIRARSGRLEIRWYYQHNRRIRLPTPAPSSAASAATVVTTVPIEALTRPDVG